MIKFNCPEKRKYDLVKVMENGTETVIHNYNLIYSPGSNKYDVLFNFVKDMCNTLGEECENWYINLIQNYKAEQDFEIIRSAIPKIQEYCDKYLNILNINFDGYIDKSKASKSSIFFDSHEIEEIIRVSSYLKVYYTLYKDMNLEISQRFNNQVFQVLIKRLVDSPIIIKIHKIVSSKTFEYNQTDKCMWNFIKNMLCRTPDMHITNIFNFVVNYILVTCEIDKNPIPYLISVIDESIKWILRTTYKDSVIYTDSIATQDINNVVGRDNLKTYAHNNTIGHLCVIAYDLIEDIFGEDAERIEHFKSQIESIKELSIVSECITYPILSKLLDIPYRHFLTLSVTTSYVLNALLFKLMEDTYFEENYPCIRKILLYHNTHRPITKTSYKIKNLMHFIGSFDHFLGFKNRATVNDIYSQLIGRITKNEYIDFITGNIVPNFQVSQLETEFIDLYNKYFSGKLDEHLDVLRQKIDIHF